MALGDLHIFTGEEYVDTELAPLLNENFNSLKEYVDDASRIKTYYSQLSQIGITPGQETFASIHNALPINSVLEYYVSEAQNFADIYPASYGNFIATRLTGKITIFHFTGTNQIIYVTHYHVTNNTNPSWTQLAKQSDLTNLSNSLNNLNNSVVKTLDNVAPVNNNIKMWNWFHRYPSTDFTNGLTTLEWVNKGLFSCFFSQSHTFPRKPADWGQLINIPATEPYMGSSDAFQLFIAQPEGHIYYRGTDANKQLDEVPFKRITYENGGIVSANLAQNGYVKFANGLILQWGTNDSGYNEYEGESDWFAFPVNFNSACFALFCGLRNTDTNYPENYDSEVQPRNWTTSKFNVYKQDYGGNPWFGNFIWFAIGQ